MSEMQSSASAAGSGSVSDTDSKLQRILAAVEQDRRRGRLELVLAVILSLATLASTWCGYQARLWGNVQSSKQSAADTAERKAAEDSILGLQFRTFDAVELSNYWTALRQKDVETRDAIFARMRPQLKKALEISLAAGVLTDPTVPGPFQRPEYSLAEEQNAKRLRQEALDLNAGAQIAGHSAGEYVLLTLMFASVLFFGGITGTFTAKRVRIGLAFVAFVLFMVTTVVLVGLPVCKS